MSFRDWQPQYAAHGIATFPVVVGPDGKKPLVSNYARFGLRASAEIARKFPDAIAIGFMLGRRSRLTVLDIDSPDERVLADELDRRGPTPIIARSGSGNYQAWYAWNGERRLIRPEPDRPIDVLGGGFVVAPPSRGTKSNYQFIEGGLDDLNDLPHMRGLPANINDQTGAAASPATERIRKGARNKTLWEQCMKAAHQCDDLDALLDVAHTRNAEFLPPLTGDEVVKIAKSAWGYTERGENRFGQPGAFFSVDETNSLIATCPDMFVLLAFLRANNGPHRTFMIANELAKSFGWSRKRLAAARLRLTGTHIEIVRPASQKRGPALYRWIKGGQIRPPILN